MNAYEEKVSLLERTQEEPQTDNKVLAGEKGGKRKPQL